MPKIKMISRNPDDYLRETKKDIHKVPRNYDPALHPFEAPREYARALNAAKLERVFAKPFLGSLDGHCEGVFCMCTHPTRLSLMLSGAYDGELRIWNLARRQCSAHVKAHEGHTRGICYNPKGEIFYTCGDDKTIKAWNTDLLLSGDQNPVNTILGKTMFQGIDHHRKENTFATCGDRVDIWDETRSEPIRSFTWGVDSVNSIKFNPIESNLLGATGQDRSIVFYDMRGATPLRKVFLKMRSNKLCWNPMEAFIFTVANEDYNLYSYDMRNLRRAVNVHMDHTSAVLDVDYSPTGQDFVSGSYDKSIRIFPVNHGRSREVYHTKRMQRVVCVKWTLDDKFILSGSDEMNIRIWKANASEKLGSLKPREKVAFDYNQKIKEKYSEHPKISRILRHRHVPKSIMSDRREHRIIREAAKRKEANVRLNSKAGSKRIIPEREKAFVNEAE